MGTYEAIKRETKGKNKGARRGDRKMPRDRVRGRRREKTSGQWLCGLNLGCRMTTHTTHTHTCTNIQTNTHGMSPTLLLLHLNS